MTNLRYVSPGDAITAERYNALVDATGGADIPSKSFVKTPQGTVFSDRYNKEAQANQPVQPLFMCKTGPALKHIVGQGPLSNFKPYEDGSQHYRATDKHIYMYLGVDNLHLDDPYMLPYQNPQIRYASLNTRYIGWCYGGNCHIICDEDFYANNPDSDFQEGQIGTSAQVNVYNGWVETPFDVNENTQIYGAFYSLYSSEHNSTIGTIFILFARDDSIDEWPVSTFPDDFTAFGDGTFTVWEQLTTPLLICQTAPSQKVPNGETSQDSSKLVQYHTGSLFYDAPQYHFGQFKYWLDNCNSPDGDPNYTSHGHWMMFLSESDWTAALPSSQGVEDSYEIIEVDGRSILKFKNTQAQGKPLAIELDPNYPELGGDDVREYASSLTGPAVVHIGNYYSYPPDTTAEIISQQAWLLFPPFDEEETPNAIF